MLENYHSRPEVSATQIKSMASGWRQFEAEHIAKTAVRKETPAMALGTAIHAALLEPKVYETGFVVTPKEASDRRTKAYKEWAKTVGDQRILSIDDAAIVDRVCEAVDKSQMVSSVLCMPGEAEKEIYWRCMETGVACRAKLDKLCGSVVLDVKTTDDAKPAAFARTVGKFRYDLQASHYLDGAEAQAFIFIAVEKQAPFRVRLYEIAEIDLKDANEYRVELLQHYKQRIDSGDWSEAGEEDLQTIFVPNYCKA